VLTDPEIGKAGDYDSVNVILTTASGGRHITNSRRATYGYDQRIEVHGSKGSVAAENHHLSRVIVANERGLHPPAAPRLLHDALHRRLRRRDRGLRGGGGAGHAHAHHRAGRAPALALADAALKSVAEGRVVKVARCSG
jgi:myo-inositol 2-dehydrogenase / D-chiro-inositol 1-dehydrogenase